MRRIADAVEAVVLGAVVVFVVLLFTNDPTAPPPSASASAGASAGESGATVDPGALYGSNCAGCHGGDGSGGIGPRLAGRMATAFPEPADQIEVVSSGRAGMPAFESRLSDAEIAAIVEYTRDALATP